MGEAVTVLGAKSFTVTFSDSMEVYRRFVQSNPNLAFQLNFYWRHEGVKYPGRSEAVRDTVLDYFTTLADKGGNACQQMMYACKHKINKQKAILQLELEVIGAQTMNGYNPVQGAVVLPNQNLLDKGAFGVAAGILRAEEEEIPNPEEGPRPKYLPLLAEAEEKTVPGNT